MDAWRCGTCRVRMRTTRRKTLVNARSRSRVRTDGRIVVLGRVRSSKKRLTSSRPTTCRTCHRPVAITVHIVPYDRPSWTARSLTIYASRRALGRRVAHSYGGSARFATTSQANPPLCVSSRKAKRRVRLAGGHRPLPYVYMQYTPRIQEIYAGRRL